jgi:hypothetical protein
VAGRDRRQIGGNLSLGSSHANTDRTTGASLPGSSGLLDAIVVRPDHASGFDVTLPRADITRLDVSVARHTRKARFALLGLGAGSLVGAVVGAASYSDPCTSQPSVCSGFIYETRGSDVFGGAVSGAVLGAIAGTITGQLSRTDEWMQHSLGSRGASLRVLPAPSRGRSVLALTMTVRD